MNDLGRVFNFAPTMPPLVPSVTPYSLRFVTSSRKGPRLHLRFCPTLCQGALTLTMFVDHRPFTFALPDNFTDARDSTSTE